MLKKLGFSVLSFVLLLMLAEFAVQQFEQSVSDHDDPKDLHGGWQERFFTNVFDWHEPDPELLWHLKPNLSNQYIRTNSSGTIGSEIVIPKSPSSYRILLLGDSSPLGLGLESYDQSFGSQLPTLLQSSFGSDRRVELINASVAGYSSEQLRRYLEMHGEMLKPNLVILYCGNNDASISGRFSDRELMEGERLKWLRSQLSRFALYRMMRAAVEPSRQTSLPDAHRFKVRVPSIRFGENITAIATQCRRLNCRLVIIKPPVPLLWPAGLQFKWFSSMTSSDGQLVMPDALSRFLNRPIRYCLDRDQLPSRYSNPDKITRRVYASAYWDTLAADSAIEYYQNELVENPDSPILLNNLGVAHWELGDHEIADHYLRAARRAYIKESAVKPAVISQAFGSVILFNIGINLLAVEHDSDDMGLTYLDSALQADYLSLRVKQGYLAQIDSIGGRDDNVIVVDMSTVFANNGGESLFVDHCHPTSGGHRLIAEELFEALVNR